jgi:pre-mRNA-splicing factor ISY1
MYDAQGREIPGFGGYRYFGAAKDLPGVKDIYKREIPIAP